MFLTYRWVRTGTHSTYPAARTIGSAIIEQIEEWTQFPFQNRKVPEVCKEEIREVVFPPYRIVYEVSKNQRMIIVLRVWHSSRGQIDLDL